MPPRRKPRPKKADETGHDSPDEEENENDTDAANNDTGIVGGAAGEMTGIVGDEVEQKADAVGHDPGDEAGQEAVAALHNEFAGDDTSKEADEQADEEGETGNTDKGKGETDGKAIGGKLACLLIVSGIDEGDNDALDRAEDARDHSNDEGVSQAMRR